jgi:hypothetical protein
MLVRKTTNGNGQMVLNEQNVD